MAATKLGLYELLAPQFLLGFAFPEHVDRYLAIAGVDELRIATDEAAVVYTGRISFGGDAGANPVREHRDPSGAVFQWEDVTLDFRLTIPRDGADFIQSAVNLLAGAPASQPELRDLFTALGTVEQADVSTADYPNVAGTEYPGVRFRLELLLSLLTFHLGSDWGPGIVANSHRIAPDPAATSQDVKFVLPKMVFEYEQGDDLSKAPRFRVKSWGNAGFDAPSDLAMGELLRMDPPIAIHRSGRVAFGIDQAIIDLSPDHTPPEILEHFGTDEGFEGLYLKSIRLYYADGDKGLGFHFAVNDCLISFKGEVSLEASLDIFGPSNTFDVTVQLFDGPRAIEFTQGTAANPAAPRILTGGLATIPQTGIVHVSVAGGAPPFTISVRYEGTELWDNARRDARISPSTPLRPAGTGTLVVTVTDSASPALQYSHTLALTITGVAAATDEPDGAAADRPVPPNERPNATFGQDSVTVGGVAGALPAGFTVSHDPAATGLSETISIVGGPTPTVRVNGQPRTLDGRRLVLDVPEGSDSSPISIQVTFPGSTAVTEDFRLSFTIDTPAGDANECDSSLASIQRYVTGSPGDTRFNASHAPSQDGRLGGRAALVDWIDNHVVGSPKSVLVDGYASYEPTTSAEHDIWLSCRRRRVAVDIIGARATVAGGTAHGHTDAEAAGRNGDNSDRVAIIRGTTTAGSPEVVWTGHIARGTRPAAPPPRPVDPAPDPGRAPDPEPNRPPPVFRRIGFRIRLERNVPVLLEVSGSLDFETELESRMRNATSQQSESLDLRNGRPGADDGVVDFKVQVTYDTSTHTLTETLALHAGAGDTDGLCHMDNPHSGPITASNRFKDAFGAVLVFTPIINSVAASVDPKSAGDWAVLAASLTIPVFIGALGVFQTERIVLYGGELKFRQVIPPGESLTFTDAGVVFDYGVEFKINVDAGPLQIHSTRPLKVRYRAVGFNLHFPGGVSYEPIFDTSKGYELDLSDPGLLNLPSPLGDVLRILGARVARVNPTNLELDIGLKVNLGIITVDRFRLKWPLEPLGMPSILPTGVSVNLPNVLAGSGYVNILDGGFEGALDLTIVPVKIRVAASLGVRSVEKDGRKATAVFAGLTIEFPTPIVLGATGLGIFGFSGLFAMHYARTERPRAAGDSVAPALRWLERAKGEPEALVKNGDVLWAPEIDRWSFGVGIIAGTIEGGFLINFRGMFVLELPGPRILIFVKVQIIQQKPKKDDTGLTMGILGVIDLNFFQGNITIGILIDLSIKDIIALKIPIDIYFEMQDAARWPGNDSKRWHLAIGAIEAPASALVLNLVRASGYFVIAGDEIRNFPAPSGARTLPGVAVATGVRASITLGSTAIGLYLKVAAGADLGISFSPFYIAGSIFLTGELRIFIISIEARGLLSVESPPTVIHGEICGKVDFFFFSIEGCVGFTIGSGSPDLTPPALVRGLWLQSHAPVLTAGQGGDRPIDASLGNALPVNDTGVVDTTAGLVSGTSTSVGVGFLEDSAKQLEPGALSGKLLITNNGARFHIVDNTATRITVTAGTPAAGAYAVVNAVPIDSVPVIQLLASPALNVTSTFTEALAQPPGLTPGGWVDTSGDRQVRYTLRGLVLDPPLPASDRPPATWRRERPPGPQGTDTSIDLAVMSRAPLTGERAVERSTDLNERVKIRWQNLCAQPAPAVCVLWTFCHKPLGPSGQGWQLTGVAEPDPPGTVRTGPPPLGLYVEEAPANALGLLVQQILLELGLPFEIAARVIGDVLVSKGLVGPVQPVAPPVEVMQPPIRRPIRIGPLDRVPPIMRPIGSRPELLRPEVTLPEAARPSILEPGILELAPGIRPSLDVIDALRKPRAPSPCARALELPRLDRVVRDVKAWIKEHPELKEQLPKLLELLRQKGAFEPWITLHTGPAKQVLLFMAVSAALLKRRRIVVRELGPTGDVVREHALADLPLTVVSGTVTGLPAPWVAAPWRAEVIPMAGFLAGAEFAGLVRLVAALDPSPKCDRVQIAIVVPKDVPPAPEREVRDATVGGMIEALDRPLAARLRPEVLDMLRPNAGVAIASMVPEKRMGRERAILGAVQVCSLAEAQRAQEAALVRDGEISAVTGYLNDGSPVPLLAKGTAYTLRVDYDAEGKAKDGTVASFPNRKQRFRFYTDDSPPARLDPWVLGTSPNPDERFHFYEDPLKVVFNDMAIVQLFKSYGKKLRAVLRAADGVPPPADEITTLSPVTSQLGTPLRDALMALAATGAIPCTGELSLPAHGSYTPPASIKLRPLMAYTFDIEVDPADPANTTTPSAPLYRRAFNTSRFATLGALAGELRARKVRHRALSGRIVLGGTGALSRATDVEIEDALRAAGEASLPAPDESGVVVYWAKRPSSTVFSPHAILFDAAEPLWRDRLEPRLETVPNQSDPAFKRIVPSLVSGLDVIEQAGAHITRFVRSPSGTRTIAFISDTFAAGSGGTTITLAARRNPSALYNLSLLTEKLVEIRFTALAPWEE